MQNKKWGVGILTAMVVGNMVGAGIFMLPSTLAKTASPLATILTWLLTGFGVLTLAFVFGNLAIRRPDLTTGPQSHAYALFSNKKKGRIAGFSMVWGYWVANWASNVAIITSFAGYLTTFFPVMTSPDVLFTIGSFEVEVGKGITFLICSSLLWATHFLLVRGVHGAGKITFIATATKIIGFALFIVVALFAFQTSTLGEWYTPVVNPNGEALNLLGQVNQAAILTLWAFIGIESAVLFSNRAKSQQAVKQATIFGLLITLVIYLAITLLTMGVVPADVLKTSDKPFVDALNIILGTGGGQVMALLGLTCLFGSILGWVLLASEVPYQAAKLGFFPKFFAHENEKGSPTRSLLITNFMSQLFIFSTLSGSITEAYDFVIVVSTLAYLIPYLVSPIFQLKLVFTGETYDTIRGSRTGDAILAVLAITYSVYAIISGSGDIKTFALGIGLFFVGFILYPLNEQYERRKMRKVNEEQKIA
ncbi:amino acid permease [Priestia taiwanensis]|uniref:Arginine:ornithine antiporter n=1 Tax=Priestia taiwanensis TaxID=1347902 RepID=A0A917ASR9_9BACI|nr:amino acid permease [Priestia taiwanensis]MBM7364273.1 arginine:ornithine antiporter/lysine permease [Priestia taiwanensis]GGE73139.1 arginine:ornithine antiporter [Priestia taiwanensis]